MKKEFRTSFQRRMFGILAVFLLILFFLLSVIIGFYVSGRSIADAAALQGETVENCAQKLEQMISDMDTVSVQLVANHTIQNVFHKISEKESSENYFENHFQARKDLEMECSAINMATNMVDAIYIYRKPYDFFSYNTERYDKKRVRQFLESNDLEHDQSFQNGYYLVLGPHIDPWTQQDETRVISLVRPLIATYYSKELVATLEVQYRYSKLQKLLDEHTGGIRMFVVDTETKEQIYPDTEKQENLSYSELVNKEVRVLKTEQGQKVSAYRYDLANCGWSVIGAQSYAQYMRSTWLILGLISILCIGFSFLTLLGVFLVTSRLTRPIRELREALKDVTLENVTLASSYEGNNEIELLQERFQQTLTALQQSAGQVTIAKTAEYQAKIDAMQAQINPHFLYNSLMSISAAGQERDARKVQNMCSQLSDIFRYASQGGADATLQEELQNVENYLAFMKFRYLDELTYTIESSEGSETVTVPKLILQPILENCFQHGFYMTEPPFCVGVKCRIEAERWYVEIADNGGGFSAEKQKEIAELRHRIDTSLLNQGAGVKIETHNMALLNVYTRLKVLYQERTVFSVQNRDERGAVVRIGGTNR